MPVKHFSKLYVLRLKFFNKAKRVANPVQREAMMKKKI